MYIVDLFAWPLIVNRRLQNIIQHPHYTNNSSRMLSLNSYTPLFHLHPTNTCQIAHVEPLVRTYRGKLSASDFRILSILQPFETQRKLSLTFRLSRWLFISNSSSQSALDALQSLDPILVLFEPPTMAMCRGSISFVYMHPGCIFVWTCVCHAPFRPDACRPASVIVVCVAGAL